MLQRSIPQYEVMRRAVTDIAGAFLLNQCDDAGVIDLGCSRGEAIAALVDEFPQVEFGGIDASAPMVAAARARFVDYPNVSIIEDDVRTHPLCDLLPYIEPTVVLAVLTLQFLPVIDRLEVLGYAYENMASGGCIILVEKVSGRTPQNERLFTHLYYDSKRRNGYSDEAIRAKATALDGVLVPVTAAENEALLVDAGFVGVECFWRWMNFAGWVAVKP
jgi:tRNA (cmo5U34)-methyltransferase